eukprot:6419605-Prymnesium_polylepis.1
MDSLAQNYDPIATLAFTCFAGVDGCQSADALNFNSLATRERQGFCTYVVFGCTDSSANNFMRLANTDSGSCRYDIFGCADQNTLQYDSMATAQPEGQICTPIRVGCMDSTARNFLPDNNMPGECFYEVLGCMFAEAINYDSIATRSDGSCIVLSPPPSPPPPAFPPITPPP